MPSHLVCHEGLADQLSFAGTLGSTLRQFGYDVQNGDDPAALHQHWYEFVRHRRLTCATPPGEPNAHATVVRHAPYPHGV